MRVKFGPSKKRCETHTGAKLTAYYFSDHQMLRCPRWSPLLSSPPNFSREPHRHHTAPKADDSLDAVRDGQEPRPCAPQRASSKPGIAHICVHIAHMHDTACTCNLAYTYTAHAPPEPWHRGQRATSPCEGMLPPVHGVAQLAFAWNFESHNLQCCSFGWGKHCVLHVPQVATNLLDHHSTVPDTLHHRHRAFPNWNLQVLNNIKLIPTAIYAEPQQASFARCPSGCCSRVSPQLQPAATSQLGQLRCALRSRAPRGPEAGITELSLNRCPSQQPAR